VTNAPTRYGNVTFSIAPTACTAPGAAAATASSSGSDSAGASVGGAGKVCLRVQLVADFVQTKGVKQYEPTLNVRVRDASGGALLIASAAAVSGHKSDCVVSSVDAQKELVVVEAGTKESRQISACELLVTLG